MLVSVSAMAQSTHDFMVTGGLDANKTDNVKLFVRPVGFDVSYFIDRRFAVGAGADTTRQKNSFVMGARWYANDNIFVRFRGLIGTNDAALGCRLPKAVKDAGDLGDGLLLSMVLPSVFVQGRLHHSKEITGFKTINPTGFIQT